MASNEVRIVGQSDLADIRSLLLQRIGIFCLIGMLVMVPVLGVLGSNLFLAGLFLIPLGAVPALRSVPYRVRVWAVVLLFILIAILVVASRESPLSGRLWIVVGASLAAVFLGIVPGLVSLVIGLASLALPYFWLKHGAASTTLFVDDPRDWFVQISSGSVPGVLLIYAFHFAFDRMVSAEDRSRIAMENVVDMIWTCAMDRRFTFVTPSVENMLGFSVEEILSMRTSDLMSKENLTELETQLMQQADAQNGLNGEDFGFVHEVQLRRKDGSLVWTDISMKWLRDVEGNLIGLSGVSRDISARKQAEETEAALEEQLHQVQKMESIGMLAGGIAHDFNNLLGVMMGNAELLREVKVEERRQSPYLDEILKAGYRATALTRQLLLFGRKERSEPQALNLSELVDNLASMLARLIPDDIHFHCTLEEDLPSVMADPGQLEQVIVNLAVNARDAIENQGHINIATEHVRLDAEFVSMHNWARVGDFVVIRVSDNGCGIEAKHLARIFEPFYSSKASDEGTGLGLAVVFGIVQQHNGFLHVLSDPGDGTEFSIYLPTIEEPSEPIPQPDAMPAPGGCETVLLVEDDDALRRLAQRVLAQAGYRVFTAGDGESGLAQFLAHKDEIDVVFSDVVMPKLSGPEMMQRLQTECPGTKVLYATGYASPALQQRYFDNDTALIHKPYGPGQLLSRLRDILDAD